MQNWLRMRQCVWKTSQKIWIILSVSTNLEQFSPGHKALKMFIKQRLFITLQILMKCARTQHRLLSVFSFRISFCTQKLIWKDTRAFLQQQTCLRRNAKTRRSANSASVCGIFPKRAGLWEKGKMAIEVPASATSQTSFGCEVGEKRGSSRGLIRESEHTNIIDRWMEGAFGRNWEVTSASLLSRFLCALIIIHYFFLNSYKKV